SRPNAQTMDGCAAPVPYVRCTRPSTRHASRLSSSAWLQPEQARPLLKAHAGFWCAGRRFSLRPRVRIRASQRRLLVLTLALMLPTAVGFGLARPGAARSERTISLDNLAQRVKKSDVLEIRVSKDGGVARVRSGELLSFYTEQGAPVLKVLASFGATPDELANVTYTVADPPGPWIGLLLSVGLLALIGAIMLSAWRRLGDRGGDPMVAFRASRARAR